MTGPLLVATGNRGKLAEFRALLAGDRFEVVNLAAVGDAGPAVEETGRTFRANACLKASGYARRNKLWTVADDSGLCVDALGGAPGVHSARWAETHDCGKGDAANNALLLEQLEGVPNERRGARFACVLALADPEGRVALTAEASFEGRLQRAPAGAGGFGYDPLFFVPAFGMTSAELAPEKKHEVSHRGQALRRLRAMMGIL